MRWVLAVVIAGVFAGPVCRALQQTQVSVPTQSDAEEDGTFHGDVRKMLVAEQFGELDRMAEEYRRGHTRTKGGNFRLHEMYAAMDDPRLNDKDTLDHLAHVQKWVVQRPESVTARVALATSLHRWAWVARGNGFANTVPEENARLFHERHMESLKVLEGAEKLGAQDPQIALMMMQVGMADGWDKAKMQSVMERGLAVEPEYFYLQRQFADYLLPKWYGEVGASASFVTEASNRLGGERGDQMYFLVAGTLLRRGNGDFPAKQLDWEQIQRGYRSVSTTFGETGHLRNELAYMAWVYRDRAVAAGVCDRIGDYWASSVWKDRQYYDRVRDWAHGVTKNG